MSEPTEFILRGEYITLDALLKATGLASSGGAAKMLIADGAVTVDGVAETRRGRKLRRGQEIRLGEGCVRIVDGPL